LVADRGGDSFRTYQTTVSDGHYRSLLGSGLWEQKSCLHPKERIDAVFSMATHPVNTKWVSRNTICGDLPVTVFQGIFGQETCERPHTYPRVDILIDGEGVFRRAVYEHFKYPNDGAMIMVHDQPAEDLWRAGVFDNVLPHIRETLRYFFDVIGHSVAEEVFMDPPVADAVQAASAAVVLPNAEEVAAKIEWHVNNHRVPDLMAARNIFGVARIDSLVYVNELKRLVRQTAMLVHPDRHPNDPIATQKTKYLFEIISVLMETWVRG
jgi:hypothetical protein